jgi:hypothetical protein
MLHTDHRVLTVRDRSGQTGGSRCRGRGSRQPFTDVRASDHDGPRSVVPGEMRAEGKESCIRVSTLSLNQITRL